MIDISEAVQLLQQSGYTRLDEVQRDHDLVGERTIVRPLHVGQLTVSYLLGEKDSYRNVAQEALHALQQKLADSFNDDDVQQLCFELDIAYEDLVAETHLGVARELVAYARRHGRLAELTQTARRQRPHLIWPDFPQTQPAALAPKTDLAVVVAINQMALAGAAAFLAQNQVDAHFVLLTTMPDYRHSKALPETADWGDVVQAFSRTMQHRAVQFPGLRRHFFLAAPLPLAFALGCAWGVVNEGDHLYHWAGETYVQVMTVSRHWKLP